MMSTWCQDSVTTPCQCELPDAKDFRSCLILAGLVSVHSYLVAFALLHLKAVSL